MSEDIIEVERVSKQFTGKAGRLVAVDDVSFAVRQGEFLGMIGASGCGKTTLLRMMAGLISYDGGTIRIRDTRVTGVPGNIGFVFQNPALMPWKTVRENVALGMTVHRRNKMPSSEIKDRVQAQLTMTGLTDFADYLPHQISGGMQQRVGLARALVSEPDVLLMDEPLGALDAFTRMRIQQELAALIEQAGTTTMFVTHDVDEAVFLSDRILVLSSRPGRVAALVDVPLPRPRRRSDLFGDDRVTKLRDGILRLIVDPDNNTADTDVNPRVGSKPSTA